MFSANPRGRAWALALGIAIAAYACRSNGPNGKTTAGQKASGQVADASAGNTGGKRIASVLMPGDPGFIDVTFEVRADSAARTISPLIYGINSNPCGGNAERFTVFRLGGNRATAYNWENNASNAGADWQYQNDGLISASNEPAKPTLDAIDGITAAGASAIVTVPNVDYVAADKKGDGDVRASGPNYLATRFKRNLPKKSTPFGALPDPNDDAVYQDEMVAFLRRVRPHAKLLFSMDNEPDLWSHTHAEVYPNKVTYADLWKRNHDYAKATKAAYPGAEVLGPASYGFQGFVSLQDASDADGRNFLEWYLDQAREAEAKEGRRLIDYLDLHWYPEAQGGGQRIVSQVVSSGTVEARVQAPRSLWDRKYKEASWIVDALGGPIDLLHWVQKKIDAHYPGTKLAISEWNYGGATHISGAVAVADVLGIFGRDGVGLATYWPMQHEEPFPCAAFRVYRNYDGLNSAFGDLSIAATSSDQSIGSVYASLDSRDINRTVLVAINKTDSPKRAGFKIWHSATYAMARVFVLAGVEPKIKPGPVLTTVAPNAFRYEMPAHSVAILLPQQ